MFRGVRGPGCCIKLTQGFCCLCSALSGSSTTCPPPPPPLLLTSHPLCPLPQRIPSRTPFLDFESRTHRAKAGRSTTRNIFHVTHIPGSAFRCWANTWDPVPCLAGSYVLNWGNPALSRGFSPRDCRPPHRGTSTIRRTVHQGRMLGRRGEDLGRCAHAKNVIADPTGGVG